MSSAAYVTEVSASGTLVQLEGLQGCCVSEIQSRTSRALSDAVDGEIGNWWTNPVAAIAQPAEGQIVACPECQTVAVYSGGAWRSKAYMSSTDPEYDYATD